MASFGGPIRCIKSFSAQRSLLIAQKSSQYANIHLAKGYEAAGVSNFHSTMPFERRFHLGSTPVLSSPVRHLLDDSWKEVKEKFLNMDPDERRTYYRFNGVPLAPIPLENIRPWPVYYDRNRDKIQPTSIEKKYPVNFAINNRVSVGKANIIALELDCVVNSAAPDLMGGGGQNKIIHEGAGKELKLECMTLNGCEIGKAKITGGYRLPAKFLIHTSGPKGDAPAKLKACYKSCLELMKRHRLGTIAFPCISTSSSAFPAERAAHLALETVRKFLNSNYEGKPHRVCFAIHRPEDLEVYHELMQVYFPMK